MAAAELPIDGASLIEPASYAENGYPHPEWAQLRQTAPVERFEPEGWPCGLGKPRSRNRECAGRSLTAPSGDQRLG